MYKRATSPEQRQAGKTRHTFGVRMARFCVSIQKQTSDCVISHHCLQSPMSSFSFCALFEPIDGEIMLVLRAGEHLLLGFDRGYFTSYIYVCMRACVCVS